MISKWNKPSELHKDVILRIQNDYKIGNITMDKLSQKYNVSKANIYYIIHNIAGYVPMYDRTLADQKLSSDAKRFGAANRKKLRENPDKYPRLGILSRKPPRKAQLNRSGAPKIPNTSEYFWSRVVDRTSNDCHLWDNNSSNKRYAYIPWLGYPVPVSRVAAALSGLFPIQALHEQDLDPGDTAYSIRHSCVNKNCCNPAHLKVYTYKLPRKLKQSRRKLISRFQQAIRRIGNG